MLYQVIYLIKPSEALQGRLPAGNSDLADLLSRPAVWTKNQSDRSLWSSEDYLAQVKLLFLARIHQEYAVYPEYRQLLGDSPLRLEAFDRWWTVETYLVDEKTEEVEKTLDRNTLLGLANTGLPAIDQWISSLRGGMANGEPTTLSPHGGHAAPKVPQV